MRPVILLYDLNSSSISAFCGLVPRLRAPVASAATAAVTMTTTAIAAMARHNGRSAGLVPFLRKFATTDTAVTVALSGANSR